MPLAAYVAGLHSSEQNQPREEQSYSPKGKWMLSSLTLVMASIMSNKDGICILDHVSTMKEKQGQ